MCLILFSVNEHPRYPLIIAANRDESYRRPAEALAFWPDAPQVAAGRDLDASGTWLGITRQGRWAALTNYRQAGSYRQGAPSRGRLVADYLTTQVPPVAYLESIQSGASRYNGFSLLVGLGTDVYYFSNRAERYQRVEPGAHALSNHLLDTPWPKVTNGRRILRALPDLPAAPLTDLLLQSLQSRSTPADADLPDTGVGIPGERVLSPPFIVSETYGTRASTVILVERCGTVSMVEQSFGSMGTPLGAAKLRFSFDENASAVAPAQAP
jgi:uncharacterized protein with NRDE domain